MLSSDLIFLCFFLFIFIFLCSYWKRDGDENEQKKKLWDFIIESQNPKIPKNNILLIPLIFNLIKLRSTEIRLAPSKYKSLKLIHESRIAQPIL